MNTFNIFKKIRCLLYFENKRQPILKNVSSISILWHALFGHFNNKGVYMAFMIKCDIPNQINELIPKAIALITKNSCDIQLDNYLRVIYEKPVMRKQFGVCVKAMRYGTVDFSVRLIEWLELLKILGADQVFLYSYSAHKNMEKVLKYYSEQVFKSVF